MEGRNVGRLYQLKGPRFRLRFPHHRGRGRPKQIVIDYSYVEPSLEEKTGDMVYPAMISREVSTFNTLNGPRIARSMPVPVKAFSNCKDEISLFFSVLSYEIARRALESLKKRETITNIEDRAKRWKVIGAEKAMDYPPHIFGRNIDRFEYSRSVEKFFKEGNPFIQANMKKYKAWKEMGII